MTDFDLPQTVETGIGTNHLVAVSFDEGTPIPAYTGARRWNGWAMPLIPAENAAENLKKAGFYDTFDIKDDGVHWMSDCDEPEIAPRCTFAGRDYFDFSWLGLCWNQHTVETAQRWIREALEDEIDSEN